MGQPRANRIQIPTSDLEHRPHSSVGLRGRSLAEEVGGSSGHKPRDFRLVVASAALPADMQKALLWLAALSTFQFVLNVGAEIASFDSQQAFLRSGLREVGDSRHAAHDSRGRVIRDAEH